MAGFETSTLPKSTSSRRWLGRNRFPRRPRRAQAGGTRPFKSLRENGSADSRHSACETGLEILERWKNRLLIAFLLLSLFLGAAALLVLEAGLVRRAWEIEFGNRVGCLTAPRGGHALERSTGNCHRERYRRGRLHKVNLPAARAERAPRLAHDAANAWLAKGPGQVLPDAKRENFTLASSVKVEPEVAKVTRASETNREARRPRIIEAPSYRCSIYSSCVG